MAENCDTQHCAMSANCSQQLTLDGSRLSKQKQASPYASDTKYTSHHMLLTPSTLATICF
jgi:hypothetical protein